MFLNMFLMALLALFPTYTQSNEWHIARRGLRFFLLGCRRKKKSGEGGAGELRQGQRAVQAFSSQGVSYAGPHSQPQVPCVSGKEKQKQRRDCCPKVAAGWPQVFVPKQGGLRLCACEVPAVFCFVLFCIAVSVFGLDGGFAQIIDNVGLYAWLCDWVNVVS